MALQQHMKKREEEQEKAEAALGDPVRAEMGPSRAALKEVNTLQIGKR